MYSELRVTIFFAMSMLFIGEGESKECILCKKIEEERALQQAANPQQIGYYDDYIGLLEEERLKNGEKSSPEQKETDAKSKPEHPKG